MERRKAITTAAAASLTLLAGAAGLALNSGIVGASEDGNVGKISPVSLSPAPPITVYVDDQAGTGSGAAARAATPAPEVKPSGEQPTTTSAASSVQDLDSNDDRYEESDDQYEDDSGASHEYEGADDDD